MKHILAYSLLLSPIALFSAEKPSEEKQFDRVPQMFIAPETQKITNSLAQAIALTASSGKENIIIARGQSITIPTSAELSITAVPENNQTTSTHKITQPKRRKSSSEEEPCIQQ